MKVTYRWIREFVETDIAPAELADRLTMAGLEVERLESLGAPLRDVRVARVRSVRKHPQADRLSICEVDDGRGVLSVVCGAPNVRAGAYVPLAPVGAMLPDGTEIRRAKLRGEVSEGMLLSEAELGLSSNHDGLLLLDGEPTLGGAFAESVGLDDWLFEISLTPNRSDCLGVLGIAREVAAVAGGRLTIPSAALVESGTTTREAVRVEIDAPDRCSRYVARVVRGVTVGPTPLAVRLRLGSVGIRSISNVVDATNLVLLEWGHPLHAFDLAKVAERRIVVRHARAGERLAMLDGVDRELTEEDLVVADGRRPMALAGIMGGEESGVHADTTDVVLESAHFEPIGIRRSARRHGLHTEASHRFERGTDPVGLATALDRLAHWVTVLAGGSIAPGTVDTVAVPFQPRHVSLRPSRARALLGAEIDDARCIAALRSLGVAAAPAPDETTVDATIPPWRPDLEREVDLVEEIARVVGYEHIPQVGVQADGEGETPPAANLVERDLERARDTLVDHGYREVIRLAFTSPEAVQRFSFPDGRAEPIRIANPLGEDASVLATSLLPGLVDSARAQLNHGASAIRLFQAGRVHRRAGGKWPFREIDCVAAIAGGARATGPFPESAAATDFFDLKGTLEILAERLGMNDVAFRPAAGLQYAEAGNAGEVWCEGRKVGEVLMLDTELLATLGVTSELFAFELELNELGHKPTAKYSPFARLPTALRDLAIEIPDGVVAGEIRAAIESAKWVIGVELFDVYRGTGLPEGRKSLAFHIGLQHPERSLTEAEVGGVLDRIAEELGRSFGAKRR